MQKAAFVAIIGRPSSGKSTLLNRICGRKIAIVSPVPQTTRNKIRGILSEERGQLVFIDTPGFHTSQKKFNQYMIDLVTSSLEEVDLVCYIVDASRKPGEEEERLLEMLGPYSKDLVIGLNKIDLERSETAETSKLLESKLPGVRIVPISALQGDNIEVLVSALFEKAPEGEQMYPEDFYTDQDPEFRAAEIVREKAVLTLKQELPHSLFVEIADMEISEEGGELWIRAFLNVERESQKGIIIGKGGNNIRDIRVAAQKELAELFPYTVKLDLRVKVRYKWRRNDDVLRKLFPR